jgi:hypothetical protein
VIRRAAVVSAWAAALLLAPASPALADPAGPTDYRSEVIAVDPAVPGLHAEAIGGDSFLVLTVDPGLTVEVVGYRGEPYLRFLPDGTVERNERSPSAYLNEDRYAEVEIPEGATPDAEPSWVVVATDGSYAWHDHRTHWMNEARPPGRSQGDQILEGVVPLIVNGEEVDVTVISVWEPAPSPLRVALGGIAGIAAVAVAVRFRRLGPAALGLAAAALVIGLWAFGSVPAETRPSPLMWAVPAAGLVVAVVAVVAARRPGSLASTAVLLAAAELAVWAMLRWEWLWRAVIPTSLPFWVDRLGTAAVLTGGLGLAAAAARRMSRPGPGPVESV